METIIGKIDLIKKDQKGLKLDNGQWYGNNYLKEPLNNFQKGDEVKVILNDKGFLDRVEPAENITTERIPAPPVSKNATMYTSYAKDLFICLRQQSRPEADTPEGDKLLMGEAIELVKQAQEAFKNEKTSNE